MFRSTFRLINFRYNSTRAYNAIYPDQICTPYKTKSIFQIHKGYLYYEIVANRAFMDKKCINDNCCIKFDDILIAYKTITNDGPSDDVFIIDRKKFDKILTYYQARIISETDMKTNMKVYMEAKNIEKPNYLK